ncbi:Beta-glucosidase [Lactococcus sp. DD01]|nr:Beta-glucosidase [Lactococcus sp. DD01]
MMLHPQSIPLLIVCSTFNEPMVIPEAGYLYGQHFPNYSGKGKEAVQVIYNLNLASSRVINLYHEMKLKGKIGIILNLTLNLKVNVKAEKR